MAASSSQPETMKAECSTDNPKACYSETSEPVLHVTLLGGEWGSSPGGSSTINKELAIHLSNHSAVKVSLLVPEGACNYEEKREAHTYGVTIVEAKRLAAFDRLDWLSSPPHEHLMDIVVGHGVKLGRQIQVIRDSARFPNCKWVQVVHPAPEDLSRYKCYNDLISKGETKHKSEVELCKLADLVVLVGPRLREAYTSYLQRYETGQDVLSITPGLFQREFGDLVAKQDPNEVGKFKVLIFGRGDDEDFELKGYKIAAQAFADRRLKKKPYHLIFVGAPEGKQEEVREKLLHHGIAKAQLTVRKLIQSRDRLKDLLCEADLAIMPSKSEGFGLVALEAFSAGLPILVGSGSGFAKALENVPIGFSCIVNSDDPAEWAKAVEAVRIRHGMRLQEIKSLRASYGEMYSWKKQCEALVNRMQRMGHAMATSSSQPETMKAECSTDNPKACYSETSEPVLHVTLLGGEWGSSPGGSSTINRELAIHLSNHSAVKVSLLVPEGACNYEEKREAHTYGVTIVEAKRLAAFDRLDWLSSPPHEHLMDIVVGHGVKLGRQIQVIRDSARFPNCKWVQVVHPAPEDLSRYKCYDDLISKGETKHKSEVELCKLADLVVLVGPRLREAYTSYLQRYETGQDVLSITPGLFQREFGDLVAKQDPNEVGKFKVLIFGRGDDEDFELKGYKIAAQAFADRRLKKKPYHLIFVGAPEGKQEEVREKLLHHGIAEAQLTVRKLIQSRDRLKDLLCEADLAIMPSKSEGFGLVALEALSAGLPILVGSGSGFAKALENVPIGFSCIVNSDDPAEWAKAVEAVRIRHRMRLQEIKSLRASYGEMYSWKKQCEALVNRMQRMGLVTRETLSTEESRKEQTTVERSGSQSSREYVRELREKKNHIENIERQLTEMEERLREKDVQMIAKDKQLRENEKERTKLREQNDDLEKELRDQVQDIVDLQRDLSVAKEKITKYESQLTTREWLISRDEIEVMSDKCLGEGGYGQVYKGRYRGYIVAVKRLKQSSLTSQELDLFEREMNIASKCRHPCLLQFIGATQEESPLLITELMESSLRKLLGKRQLSEKEIVIIASDVAHALNYLHHRKPKPIVHRDVSSANVLLWKQNDQWRGKLGDYGTAKFLQEIMTKDPGAMNYSAPEAGSPHNQTVKIDVYSFGVLFCEMCTREIPMFEDRQGQVGRVTNREFRRLIQRCIEKEPERRPGVEEVIKKLEQFYDISKFSE